MRYTTTAYQRIEGRFVPDFISGCWLWIGAKNVCGYGILGGIGLVHRVLFRLYVGPIPKGYNLLHICDVRNCVNPDHLRIGTQAENIRDMQLRGRSKHATGIDHGHAKLSEQDVRKIRIDPRPSRTIAPEYGVDKATILSIKQQKTWKKLI